MRNKRGASTALLSDIQNVRAIRDILIRLNINAATLNLAVPVYYPHKICYNPRMQPDSPQTRAKIVAFLKKFAPFSVIDRGVRAAENGDVSECHRVGNTIQGHVKEGENNFNSALAVISPTEVDATCSCCSTEEIAEQWCDHAVALLVRASDLGFLDNSQGFSARESTFRSGITGPFEVADLIKDIKSTVPSTSKSPVAVKTEVEVRVSIDNDRLGIAVFFNGNNQGTNIFKDASFSSQRALDNILIDILEREGSWDEASEQWIINSSDGISMILGILEEYKSVTIANTGAKFVVSSSPLDSQLILSWEDSGLKVRSHWLSEDGKVLERGSGLIGSGPHWTLVDSTLFSLTPTASRIVGIFPYGPTISIPLREVGPVLEAVDSFQSPLIVEENAELRPTAKLTDPEVHLSLTAKDEPVQHFQSSAPLTVEAQLRFSYPAPKAGSRVVYIPNREFESRCRELLNGHGFKPTSKGSTLIAEGDEALNIVSSPKNIFPTGWEIEGLEALKKAVRFADLELHVSMGDSAEKSKSANWFECNITLTQNNATIPISSLFRSDRENAKTWVRLDTGAYARIPGGSLQALKTTLGMIDSNYRFANAIRSKLGAAQAVTLGKSESTGVNVSTDKKLKALIERFSDFSSIKKSKLSTLFSGTLRPYQMEGVDWLSFLCEYELGGILADEMGLGKTVQTLAFLQQLKQVKKTKGGPSLIVAPTSIITNWLYEARRFTPNLKVLALHGPERKNFFKKLDEFDLIITSYALLRLDRTELSQYTFEYLILDEAQNIKNPSAATTKAAKSLAALHRLALTGTPTENRPLELWSIMDFLMPGYLGGHDFFKNQIERQLMEGSQEMTRILNSKTKPFILRRTKAQVEKDLPPKIESVLPVSMTASQRSLYAQIIEEVRPKVFDAVKEKGIKGASVSILAALLRLRQVCNHPNSISTLRNLPGFDSGKFNLFKELVEEALDSGGKILVFCQFIEMLSLMRGWLDELKTPYLYLDGSTKNRQDLVDRFNSDPEIRLFLISLKAGGTGLNLASADHVIIYDPWWNPAVENQAVDRAHRIGQRKTVNVYRLVTEETVEQKIMGLKEKKSKLFDSLVNENGLSSAQLTKADLESLFSPLTPGGGEE